MRKTYRKETNCLNCGTEVTNKFCPACGQENIEIHENFFQLIREYLSDYFNYDSKILRSLVPLVTKPGFLTKEYWEGRRTNYIHPLKIFFYVTVIFALATGYLHEKYGPRMRESISGDPDLKKMDSAYLAKLKPTDSVYLTSEKKSILVKDVTKEKFDNQRKVNKLISAIDFIFINLKYVTFFLLPVYALIFKLFFRRRRKYYVDHIIFTIHLQTFFYCLFCVWASVMYLSPFTGIGTVAFMSVAGYMAISLRYIYGLKWWRTILNSLSITFILTIITSICITAFALLEAIYVE